MFSPDVEESKQKFVERSKEVINKSEDLIKIINSNKTGLKEMYADGTEIVEIRCKCLKVAVFGSDQKRFPAAGQEAQHAIAFDAFKATSQVVDWMARQSPEPVENFKDFKDLSTVLKAMSTYTFASEEEMRAEKKRIKGLADDFKTLVERCMEQTLRIKNAYNKKLERQAEQDAATRLRTEKVQEEERQQSEAKRRRTAGASSLDLFCVLRLRIVSKAIQQFEVHSSEAGEIIACVEKTPALLKLKDFALSKELAEEYRTFVESFRDDKKLYGGSKRGAKKLGAQIDEARGHITKLEDLGKSTLQKLSPSEQAYVHAPWLWAYAPTEQDVGPEFGFVGSVKLHFEGSREFRIFKFEDVLNWCSTTKAATCSWTLQETFATFGSMSSQEDMDKFLTKASDVYCGTVSKGEMLVVPPGWVLASNVINNAEAGGLRWVYVPSRMSQSWDAMLQLLIPDEAQVKPNSAAAFCKKIGTLLNAKFKSSATGGAKGLVKAELAIAANAS